jgi:uncharacterized membrane protein
MKKLSVGEAFHDAWITFKKYPWVFVGAAALMGAVSILSNSLSRDRHGLVSFLVSIAFALLSWWMYLGLVRMALVAHTGGAIKLDFLFRESGKMLEHYIVGLILSVVIILIGFVLLIIPGIIAKLGLLFVPFLILEKDMKGVESIKESWRMSKGYKWQLFGLLIVLLFLNILGALVFGVGLLVTIPLSVLMLAHAYREIEKQSAATPTTSAA